MKALIIKGDFAGERMTIERCAWPDFVGVLSGGLRLQLCWTQLARGVTERWSLYKASRRLVRRHPELTLSEARDIAKRKLAGGSCSQTSDKLAHRRPVSESWAEIAGYRPDRRREAIADMKAWATGKYWHYGPTGGWARPCHIIGLSDAEWEARYVANRPGLASCAGPEEKSATPDDKTAQSA